MRCFTHTDGGRVQIPDGFAGKARSLLELEPVLHSYGWRETGPDKPAIVDQEDEYYTANAARADAASTLKMMSGKVSDTALIADGAYAAVAALIYVGDMVAQFHDSFVASR